jgi:hypothetical protein
VRTCPPSLIVLLALMLPAMAFGESPDNSAAGAEIEFLLLYVEQSDCVFVRNGKDHDGPAAASHMRRKYEHFLAKNEVHTTEDFIRLAATRSLISGRPYRVRQTDGMEMDTSVWLQAALDNYRLNADSGPGTAGAVAGGLAGPPRGGNSSAPENHR